MLFICDTPYKHTAGIYDVNMDKTACNLLNARTIFLAE